MILTYTNIEFSKKISDNVNSLKFKPWIIVFWKYNDDGDKVLKQHFSGFITSDSVSKIINTP